MADDNRLRVLYVATRRGRVDAASPPELLRTHLDNHIAGNGASQFEWSLVTNQKSALGLARRDLPRLILVELDAPGGRAAFCATLRQRWPTSKLVVLSSLKARAKNIDCDGFLYLPLDAVAVAALLGTLLDGYQGHMRRRGPINLNLATRTVATPKGQYHMTPKQAALLDLLMRQHDQVLSRQEIMHQVWETNYLEDTRTLDVHIRWLRERIEPEPSEPRYLVTVRGKGYRLNLDDGSGADNQK
jgi:DNA-binding response OmpR family regulator